jgi:hypothetical protein
MHCSKIHFSWDLYLCSAPVYIYALYRNTFLSNTLYLGAANKYIFLKVCIYTLSLDAIYIFLFLDSFKKFQ